MSSAEDVVEKIKKLLRLARSANPHEAQLALQRAMALASEHRVAIEGLNPDECAKEKRTTHRDTEAESRLSYDKRYALAVVRIFFRISTVEVRCLRHVKGWPQLGVRVMFVGTTSDIEIARYVYGFLTQHFSFCWRRHRGRLRNRQAFVYGMYQGIVHKLWEQNSALESKGTELVLAEHDAYIAKVIGETTKTPLGKPDHEAHAAANAGYIHGRNTEIRPAVKAGEQLALK